MEIVKVKNRFRTHMGTAERFAVVFGQREDNKRWVAISNESPCFCFEDESLDSLFQKTSDAIFAYENFKGKE